MYEIMKNVITAGGFQLADIQHKVKKLYVLGDLTEGQADQLLEQALAFASPDAERPAVLAMLRSLAARVEALEKAQGGAAEPSDHEAWRPWDGISDQYQQGAVVSHGDKLWQSVFAGQNVWEPGTVGTENLWVEYEEA